MSTPYEITLQPMAQRFDVNLGGTNYLMIIVWNAPANCWILDILATDGTMLATGIPLITGADLLAQLRYLGFTGGLIVTVDNGIGVPTYANLGIGAHLYFVTTP